jgi:23S rRNA (cytidine1920-2'-O)/16S rRNA (cytidine1409-2'-O)-methyltransferase
VDEQPAMKPGVLVRDDVALNVDPGPRYVGRGGDKLEHALREFGIDVSGLVAADIGSSTGGFTDCLLQHGARKVYAIDVGKNQLDYRLRTDSRVVVMEGVNAREFELPERADVAVVDVSFISLRMVLPSVAGVVGLKAEPQPGAGTIVALFKPQFEAARDEVPRGGVIRDAALHDALLARFEAWCAENSFEVLGQTPSPILGAEGNREFFFWLRPSAGGV